MPKQPWGRRVIRVKHTHKEKCGSQVKTQYSQQQTQWTKENKKKCREEICGVAQCSAGDPTFSCSRSVVHRSRHSTVNSKHNELNKTKKSAERRFVEMRNVVQQTLPFLAQEMWFTGQDSTVNSKHNELNKTTTKKCRGDLWSCAMSCSRPYLFLFKRTAFSVFLFLSFFFSRCRGWHQHISNSCQRASWHRRLADHQVGDAGHRSGHPRLHGGHTPVRSWAAPCGRSQRNQQLPDSFLVTCNASVLLGEALSDARETPVRPPVFSWCKLRILGDCGAAFSFVQDFFFVGIN